MIKRNHFLSPLALFSLLCCFGATGNAAEKAADTVNTQAEGKAVWAWADKSGSEHAIFISRQVGETWEKPQIISAKEGVNIVPAVINTSGEDLMVVWSNHTGSQAQLRYRQMKDGLWSEEKEYYTGLSSNMAASISVDGKGKIWMVWAGYNGISDEIYYTTWNGTSFATATAITANDVPDIQPVLGIDAATGTPWVQWLQFSDKGYVKLESAWNGSEWGEPLKVQAAESSTTGEESSGTSLAVIMKKANTTGTNTNTAGQAAQATATTNQLEIEIPEFVTSPESASIHIPGYTVQSLPVRIVAPIK